jgi:hypothetical protein
MNTALFVRILAFFGGPAEFGIHNPRSNDGQGGVHVRQAKPALLPMLWARNKKGCHAYVRPGPVMEPHFLLVDDVNRERLAAQHGFVLDAPVATAKPGRMIVETSPGNHQVWIRSRRPLEDVEKSLWLSTLGSDPGAAPRGRWGRLPGFLNVKPKHQRPDGSFPMSRLLWLQADPVDLPMHPDMPCADAENATRARVYILRKKEEEKRTGNLTLARRAEPRREDFERADASAQDFAWCLSLMRFGLSDADVAARLREAREAVGWAGHHDQADYIERTVRRAREVAHAAPPLWGR